MPRHVAIVGANLAGGRAAEALRTEGFDGSITLIGDEPDRPYERPPLSKEILRGEWPPSKAFLQDEDFYETNDITLRLGTRATKLDPAAASIDVEDGDAIEADAVVLCTGGRPRRLDLPGADGDHVFTLRTLADAKAIAARVSDGDPVVVIGAGFIGAEVAASLTQVGCSVTLLEVADVPLERALGREVGEIYASVLTSNGVDLRTGVNVERIDDDSVALADGTTVEARAVIMGVGIDPNVELARDAGLDCDNGIVVDASCRTSNGSVFAAGDVANHPNPILGERIRVEHWQNAQSQAAVAAKAILGQDVEHREVPWFWSDQFDATIQMAGHPTSWERIVYRGDRGSNFSAFYLSGERLVAAFALGRSKDVRGARAVIEAGLTLTDEEYRDESVDLRKRVREATG